MSNAPNTQVTELLERIRGGDDKAGEKLIRLVYTELRSLAGALAGRNASQNTLQPTALVHEAWMKLVGNLESFECRRHFFAVAAKAMRQVLADRVRDAKRQKRGGGRETVVFDDAATVGKSAASAHELDLIDLDAKLTELADLNERHARVVEMRLLGSMTMQEIADELRAGKRSIESDWQFARAWLRRELLGA